MTLLYDDDPQDGALTEPGALRELIIAQGLQETGIFVLLFTSETADGNSESTGDDTVSAAKVSRKAAEVGVDTAHLTLFSEDAYLLQGALGETFVAENS